MKNITPLFLLIIITLVGALSLSIAQAQTGVTLTQCPQSEHDQFRTSGPNGVMYATWHPAIHSYNAGGYIVTCYFDHEHGSNPALANPDKSQWPLFGYTAPEPHAGFKNYVFDLQGVRWLITHHFGTGNAIGAACVQFHTLDLKAYDLVTGELYADVHTMADHGQSRVNTTGVPLTPASCPDNSTRSANGIRLFPSVADGNVGYEPWRAAHGANVIGFDAKHMTVNTTNPQQACDDGNCNSQTQRVYAPLAAVERGTVRFITLFSGFGFTVPGTGESYTDAMGSVYLTATDPGAVRQWIKPGWTWVLAQSGECRQIGLDYYYQCDQKHPAIRTQQQESSMQWWPFVTGGN
jgi:hypothetical protein